MDKQEIIELAKEAGFTEWHHMDNPNADAVLQAFAALVQERTHTCTPPTKEQHMSLEVMKQALEALENPWTAGPDGVAEAITALRTAIKQARSAQQKPWVGLTDEELTEAEIEGGKSYKRWVYRIGGQMLMPQDSLQWHFSRAIEAKLKEKNQ